MNDPFGRKVDYLRLSITDRCNERCTYCMPVEHSDWLPREQILRYEEILRTVRVAVSLGFRRFRVTGGEPLVRRNAVEFIEQLCAIPGVDDVSMTTNATRLAPVARRLADAGLRSVNISLDALDADVYQRVTRGRLDEALAGIDAALDAGFDRIKLNAVLMRGASESQVWPLARFAAERDVVVRFIELMPVTSRELIGEDAFLSMRDAMDILRERDTLTALPHAKLGAGPAVYHRLESLGSTVGFISAMTDDHFCETCNKVRLTADGFIRPCLGNHGEIDLKPALRDSAPGDIDAAITDTFRRALAEKPAEHIFRDQYVPLRIMTAIGG
ncbi:MAG: GTP 3',8-cyclase MoaA [Phycisphaera sp.]|nr:GTP 3',8-cyclase MoaA [Phycisphaera sp.]